MPMYRHIHLLAHNIHKRFLPSCALIAVCVALTALPTMVSNVIALLSVLYIACYEYPQLIPRTTAPYIIMACCHLLIPLACLLALNMTPSGRWIVALTLALTMINDTAAYLGGSLYGSHTLAPRISPKKTIEGTAIGLLATLLVTCLIAYYCQGNVYLALAVGTGLSLCATLGDLYESYLKRRAGIKDTGTLLGGHGGLLDRFDSFLFTIVYAYGTVNWYRLLFNL